MDLLTLAQQDTGAEFPQTSSIDGGEHTGPCPVCGGTDRFHVWPNHHSGEPRYKCMGQKERRSGCGIGGDTIQYYRDVHGMTFDEAKAAAGGGAIVAYKAKNAQKHEPPPVLRPPGQKWQKRARSFVQYSQETLWSSAGEAALAYLHGERGYTDEAIRKWGLGYNPAAHYDDADRWGVDGKKVYLSPGIVIPCEIGGALWYVQVRRPTQDADGFPDTLSVGYLEYVPEWQPTVKYMAVKGGEGKALFGADELRGDRPLLLCEGEFDAILAWQELHDLADVATLGGAVKGSAGIPGRWLLRLLPYKVILVAFDADRAGDGGAAELLRQSRRARRVKVPQGGDLCEFRRQGGDLAAWLAFCLATMEG